MPVLLEMMGPIVEPHGQSFLTMNSCAPVSVRPKTISARPRQSGVIRAHQSQS